MENLLTSARWRALGVTVHVLVDGPQPALATARNLVEADLAALDLACSRFRPDSEVTALAAGGRHRVSPLLAECLRAALDAAQTTDGDLDPTIGARLAALGYDRDFDTVTPVAGRLTVSHRVNWRDVHLDAAGWVELPAGTCLDLGATAKALCADRAATRASARVGCGVLVNLGGDVAVGGPAPATGWAVQVRDSTDREGPGQTVAITSGGLATSSTTARRWQQGGGWLHHILDPRSGQPATGPWRTVSATGADCLAANVVTTTAVIRGAGALRWLRATATPARLVAHDGAVTTLNGWPA